MDTNNRYKNKLFSILGDSISTLEWYSEPREAAYYDTTRKMQTGVVRYSDTWWGNVIENLGGELLINNSFSGSTVTKRGAYMIESFGCSNHRTSRLCENGRTPDVIMIYMGTNDWGAGVKVTPRSDAENTDNSIFSVAYSNMLSKITDKYPQAEIWCLTLPISKCNFISNFEFPYHYGGRHIEEYCNAISQCAHDFNCRVIDLYKNQIPHDTIDGFHPDVFGMRIIAEEVLRQVNMFD